VDRTNEEYTDNVECGFLNNIVFHLTKPNMPHIFGDIKFKSTNVIYKNDKK